MVGAGGACVFGSAEVVVVVVMVTIAGTARDVLLAAFAGVIVVVLVAVGSGAGASLPPSARAAALPTPIAIIVMKTRPKVRRIRRRRPPTKASSATVLHPAIAPAGMVLQPKRFFWSLYWLSGAWHHSLAKVQPGEWSRYVSRTWSTATILSSRVVRGPIVATRSAVDASVASVRLVLRRSSGSSQTSSFVACAGPPTDSTSDPFTESSQFRTTVIFIPSGVRYVCVKLSWIACMAWPMRR